MLGCTPEPPAPEPAPVPTPEPAPLEAPAGTLVPLGEVVLPGALPEAREAHRMTIDQLDASIRTATGGIGWDVDGQSRFAELSGSLGVPNYATTTAEDREPGLLFQKFLDDAANAVCNELIDREVTGRSSLFLQGIDPDASRATAGSDIDQALSDAVLRFHGRRMPPGDPALETWTFLFDATVSSTGGNPRAAWYTVCVGLITHPDFYQY